ncbi:Uncharacterized protein FWK35_00015558 [Aphis craccivora]|uniref:Uncharacterized protein n=1 Tax=Aphis craccivora TaxID=307492 RepID=A0A6G0ZEU4_APHCR|nr:Uncharacterized protein FWK35_00015558 [Aphis craccivora]
MWGLSCKDYTVCRMVQRRCADVQCVGPRGEELPNERDKCDKGMDSRTKHHVLTVSAVLYTSLVLWAKRRCGRISSGCGLSYKFDLVGSVTGRASILQIAFVKGGGIFADRNLRNFNEIPTLPRILTEMPRRRRRRTCMTDSIMSSYKVSFCVKCGQKTGWMSPVVLKMTRNRVPGLRGKCLKCKCNKSTFIQLDFIYTVFSLQLGCTLEELSKNWDINCSRLDRKLESAHANELEYYPVHSYNLKLIIKAGILMQRHLFLVF